MDEEKNINIMLNELLIKGDWFNFVWLCENLNNEIGEGAGQINPNFIKNSILIKYYLRNFANSETGREFTESEYLFYMNSQNSYTTIPSTVFTGQKSANALLVGYNETTATTTKGLPMLIGGETIEDAFVRVCKYSFIEKSKDYELINGNIETRKVTVTTAVSYFTFNRQGNAYNSINSFLDLILNKNSFLKLKVMDENNSFYDVTYAGMLYTELMYVLTKGYTQSYNNESNDATIEEEKLKVIEKYELILQSAIKNIIEANDFSLRENRNNIENTPILTKILEKIKSVRTLKNIIVNKTGFSGQIIFFNSKENVFKLTTIFFYSSCLFYKQALKNGLFYINDFLFQNLAIEEPKNFGINMFSYINVENSADLFQTFCQFTNVLIVKPILTIMKINLENKKKELEILSKEWSYLDSFPDLNEKSQKRYYDLEESITTIEANLDNYKFGIYSSKNNYSLISCSKNTFFDKKNVALQNLISILEQVKENIASLPEEEKIAQTKKLKETLTVCSKEAKKSNNAEMATYLYLNEKININN